MAETSTSTQTGTKLANLGSSVALTAKKTLTASTDVSLTGRQSLGAAAVAFILGYGFGGTSGYNNAKDNVEPVITMPPGLQFHKPNLGKAK